MPWWWLMAPPASRVARVTPSHASTVVAGRPRVPGRGVVGAGAVRRPSGEGEVEAGAVRVGVALVGRGRKGPVDRAEGVDDGPVEGGQRRPPGRDLDGVDHHARPPERGEGGHVVAVAQPAVDQVGAEHLAAAALVVDDGERRGHQGRIALVEHDEDVGVGQVEGASRLGRVVEAEHGRGGAAAQDAAAGVQAVGERGEAERPTDLARRAPGGPGNGRR